MGTVIAGYELGAVPDSALPEENGWSRSSVWYGDEVGGDEALTSAWSTRYVGPNGVGCDLSAYVYGDDPEVVGAENVTYGVVQVWEDLRVDENGERDEDYDGERVDEGLAPSFATLDEANAYARSRVMADVRWQFAMSHPA
jgi:hypothetical protein